jgi:adenine-specific DNA-methyltransferase
MSKYDDLVKKLKEVFQIDKPQLDFGIYRILNSRVEEINDYLDNRLSAKVQASLSNANAQNLQQLEQQLQDAIKQAESLGVSSETIPKVIELRQQLTQQKGGASEHENAVYSHLLTFFSRYYEKGDFISQRRYKGDTYAVPYAGEEVVLHWANKDQYYTKSGENFSNYAFKLEDGRTVRCRLISADTAKDNRKDNDKERRFVLIDEHTRIVIDDEGDEIEEHLIPVEEINGELVLRFEYKPMPKGSKQDDLVLKAVGTIQNSELVKTNWTELNKLEPTEKNPKRTLLEKALTNYTAKNTADYFIHKDLGLFLRRELDFYIKNEVMNLDDVQNAQAFADIEKNLRLIQTLREIALDLVTFLAQLEDFQKKLWLKKKFVVSAHYCITLDRVPESLYPKIAANSSQWEQWESLGMLVKAELKSLFNQAEKGTVDYLKANPFLMVDTALFDSAFKYELLAQIHDLDDNLDGLLIHGDNFQALNLLQERYREQVKCVYIDPPYNTSASEILYKNEYKDSSWLSLIENRFLIAMPLTKNNAIFTTAIDHAELFNLGEVKDTIFGKDNRIAIVTIQHNPKGRNQAKFFSENSEHLLIYAKSLDSANFNQVAIDEEVKATFNEFDGKNHFRWENYIRARTSWSRKNRPNNWYPIYVSKDLKIITTEFHNDYWELYPTTRQGDFSWKNIKESFNELNKDDGYFKATEINGEISIFHKFTEQQVLKNVWIQKKYQSEFNGTNLLKDIIKNNNFDYPKSLYAVEDIIKLVASSGDLTIDYFAGSGTTAHAVINLNRQDNGNRKYILVEQGDYFDTVLKPRVQKVVYSADWKDGKATSPQTGISHAFKVLKIESYEDTLNNLELKRTQSQIDLLSNLPEAKEDYLLRYMLDIESRGSLLCVDDFKKPFDYKLKIAIDSAGAYEERKIDLIETFNYLIGLRVTSITMQADKGFATIEGLLPTDEKTLVLWRDVEKVGYEELTKLCDKLKINPADSEFEVIYINGDHNIPTTLTSLENEGGITKTLKLRQIEPEFLRLMFETV